MLCNAVLGFRINENFVSIPSFQGKALVLAPESLKQQQQQHGVEPHWPLQPDCARSADTGQTLDTRGHSRHLRHQFWITLKSRKYPDCPQPRYTRNCKDRITTFWDMEHGTQKLTLDMFLLNRLYRVESLMIFSLQASKSELPWNAMKLALGLSGGWCWWRPVLA